MTEKKPVLLKQSEAVPLALSRAHPGPCPRTQNPIISLYRQHIDNTSRVFWGAKGPCHTGRSAGAEGGITSGLSRNSAARGANQFSDKRLLVSCPAHKADRWDQRLLRIRARPRIVFTGRKVMKKQLIITHIREDFYYSALSLGQRDNGRISILLLKFHLNEQGHASVTSPYGRGGRGCSRWDTRQMLNTC